MEATGEGDRKPGRAHDKADYIELLKELHEAFEKHGYQQPFLLERKQ